MWTVLMGHVMFFRRQHKINDGLPFFLNDKNQIRTNIN